MNTLDREQIHDLWRELRRRIESYMERYGRPPKWVLVTREARQAFMGTQAKIALMPPPDVAPWGITKDGKITLEPKINEVTVRIRTMAPWAMLLPAERMEAAEGIKHYQAEGLTHRTMPSSRWAKSLIAVLRANR